MFLQAHFGTRKTGTAGKRLAWAPYTSFRCKKRHAQGCDGSFKDNMMTRLPRPQRPTEPADGGPPTRGRRPAGQPPGSPQTPRRSLIPSWVWWILVLAVLAWNFYAYGVSHNPSR